MPKQSATTLRRVKRQAPSTVICAIIGGGGHARVLIDCLLDTPNVTMWGILDREQTTWGSDIFGVKIIEGDECLPRLGQMGVTHFVVGLGAARDNEPRARLYRRALAAGLLPLSVIHPSAVISKRARLGEGNQVVAGAIVNAGAQTGVNVLLNTGSIIEHECRLGDHVHVATGARLAGDVHVDMGAFIGAGATVRQGVRIGGNAVVGAGAVVIADVEPDTVVVGVPARNLGEPRASATGGSRPHTGR